MDTKTIVKQFGKNDADFGSSSVQVGLLTVKIKMLTQHLKQHPKDLSTQRGLKRKVEARKKHLKYLKKNDLELFHKVAEFFGIRH